MTIKIVFSVIAGIGVGYFLLPDSIFQYTDIIIDIGLCLLLFFVGIDIGRNKEVFSKIKKTGFKVLLIPIMIITLSSSPILIPITKSNASKQTV